MKMELAERTRTIPPYLFARIDEIKAQVRKRGVDLIDLGIGDPDLPTPPHVVEALARAARDPRHHQYPSYVGMEAFRAAAAGFCKRRFGLHVDAAKQVVALIGSKEGIAHFPVAFVNPGDVVLVPDPGYPVYGIWTTLCGGVVQPLVLRRENGFLPDLRAIPKAVAKSAKVMWVNYPNNPTAALATREFYKELVSFALENEIILASDLAYSEIYYDCDAPPSLLEIPGAMDCAIEFHSLSKTYNMTGWRVGFAVGNETLISGLGRIKTNTDSGVFEAVQVAAIEALSGDQKCVADLRNTYRERVEVLCGGLSRAGFDVLRPKASFYCLVGTPKGMTSIEYAAHLLEKAGVVATPATGFGAGGEGYVRLTVCADKSRLQEAVERLSTLR